MSGAPQGAPLAGENRASQVAYGKWHLGASTETEPQYDGFYEWRHGFYGSSDGTLYGDHLP